MVWPSTNCCSLKDTEIPVLKTQRTIESARSWKKIGRNRTAPDASSESQRLALFSMLKKPKGKVVSTEETSAVSTTSSLTSQLS